MHENADKIRDPKRYRIQLIDRKRPTTWLRFPIINTRGKRYGTIRYRLEWIIWLGRYGIAITSTQRLDAENPNAR